MSNLEGAIWPDPMWGIFNLLDGAELLGHKIRPWFNLPVDVYSQTEHTYVHLIKHNTQTGSIDRVTEVRLIVYGSSITDSDELGEALLTFLCRDDVETPASPEAASYYFDYIEHRSGPTPQNLESDSVFPAAIVVAVGARPMN